MQNNYVSIIIMQLNDIIKSIFQNMNYMQIFPVECFESVSGKS